MNDIERHLLREAIEDYLSLKEALSELRRLRPGLNDSEYVRLMQATVAGLIKKGFVKLYEVRRTQNRNLEKEFDRDAIRQLLKSPESWSPSTAQVVQAIAGTVDGEKALCEE